MRKVRKCSCNMGVAPSPVIAALTQELLQIVRSALAFLTIRTTGVHLMIRCRGDGGI